MNHAPTILVVDDEDVLAKIVASYLEREGYCVSVVGDGDSAVDWVRTHEPELVVLDLMLPGIDGIEACRQIRALSDCYVIMLTARAEEIDKIVGLTVGADDYLVKPFSPRELVARVRALLRRPRVRRVDSSDVGTLEEVSYTEDEFLRCGRLAVDVGGRRAWVDHMEVDLTRIEFDVLAAMVAQPRRAFSRRQLIEAVWGPQWFGDEHLVDVHVGHLRRKLGDRAAEPTLIRTVRGVGYGMVADR